MAKSAFAKAFTRLRQHRLGKLTRPEVNWTRLGPERWMLDAGAGLIATVWWEGAGTPSSRILAVMPEDGGPVQRLAAQPPHGHGQRPAARPRRAGRATA